MMGDRLLEAKRAESCIMAFFCTRNRQAPQNLHV
jgi:hypothetical protein